MKLQMRMIGARRRASGGAEDVASAPDVAVSRSSSARPRSPRSSILEEELEAARLRSVAPDEDYVVDSPGEVVSIDERLVVAPCWGRVEGGSVRPGQQVAEGSLIGNLHEHGESYPLVAHCHGFFVGWIAEDGERVSPGKAVARLTRLGV